MHVIEEKKFSWSHFNNVVCALRFFYRVTLKAAQGTDRIECDATALARHWLAGANTGAGAAYGGGQRQ